LTVGANSTSVNQNAFTVPAGGMVCRVVRETTPGQGSRPIGFAVASDDVAAVHLAVRAKIPA
jgi:hypothetical protein